MKVKDKEAGPQIHCLLFSSHSAKELTPWASNRLNRYRCAESESYLWKLSEREKKKKFNTKKKQTNKKTPGLKSAENSGTNDRPTPGAWLFFKIHQNWKKCAQHVQANSKLTSWETSWTVSRPFFARNSMKHPETQPWSILWAKKSCDFLFLCKFLILDRNSLQVLNPKISNNFIFGQEKRIVPENRIVPEKERSVWEQFQKQTGRFRDSQDSQTKLHANSPMSGAGLIISETIRCDTSCFYQTNLLDKQTCAHKMDSTSKRDNGKVTFSPTNECKSHFNNACGGPRSWECFQFVLDKNNPDQVTSKIKCRKRLLYINLQLSAKRFYFVRIWLCEEFFPADITGCEHCEAVNCPVFWSYNCPFVAQAGR